ncbi:uncharacterized protein LOC118755529, partial [Rhagoletis pomonella]|uniref:uncharacterized protein LOC118755529 n=1 Tax=Rhagoletis pomonella TaxID=28610 RepID=UPI00177D42F2
MGDAVYKRSSRIKLSELTEEQLQEIMDSIDTDAENDFSSDDDIADPEYMPEGIDPEDEHIISQCIKDIDDSDIFIDGALDMSLNTSALETSLAGGEKTTELEVVASSSDTENPI